MAKGPAKNTYHADGISKKQNAKLADIYTAAKSSMEPANYEQGYPPNEGVLRNTNFTGKSSNPGG